MFQYCEQICSTSLKYKSIKTPNSNNNERISFIGYMLHGIFFVSIYNTLKFKNLFIFFKSVNTVF